MLADLQNSTSHVDRFAHILTDVAYWHLADKSTAPEFVAGVGNCGQAPAQGLNSSAAIDLRQTCVHLRFGIRLQVAI